MGPSEPVSHERVNVSRWTEPDALSDEDCTYLNAPHGADQAAFQSAHERAFRLEYAAYALAEQRLERQLRAISD